MSIRLNRFDRLLDAAEAITARSERAYRDGALNPDTVRLDLAVHGAWCSRIFNRAELSALLANGRGGEQIAGMLADATLLVEAIGPRPRPDEDD